MTGWCGGTAAELVTPQAKSCVTATAQILSLRRSARNVVIPQINRQPSATLPRQPRIPRLALFRKTFSTLPINMPSYIVLFPRIRTIRLTGIGPLQTRRQQRAIGRVRSANASKLTGRVKKNIKDKGGKVGDSVVETDVW